MEDTYDLRLIRRVFARRFHRTVDALAPMRIARAPPRPPECRAWLWAAQPLPPWPSCFLTIVRAGEAAGVARDLLPGRVKPHVGGLGLL